MARRTTGFISGLLIIALLAQGVSVLSRLLQPAHYHRATSSQDVDMGTVATRLPQASTDVLSSVEVVLKMQRELLDHQGCEITADCHAHASANTPATHDRRLDPVPMRYRPSPAMQAALQAREAFLHGRGCQNAAGCAQHSTTTTRPQANSNNGGHSHARVGYHLHAAGDAGVILIDDSRDARQALAALLRQGVEHYWSVVLPPGVVIHANALRETWNAPSVHSAPGWLSWRLERPPRRLHAS